MPKKRLRATPSCTDDVDELRMSMSNDIDAVYAKCRQDKQNFMTVVREHAAAYSEAGVMQARVQAVLAQVGSVKEIAAAADRVL